ISPGSRGDVAYGWLREGKSHALRQQFRTAILTLTKEQVIEAVKEELLPKYHLGVPVVFANRELLEKENALLQAKGQQPLAIEHI
ncbi:MAG: hypothetical protein ACXWM7_04685, partial [Parachlamydiaceae bacterium]